MAGTVGINFSIGASTTRTVAAAFGTVSSRVKGLRSDLKGLETQSKAAARVSAAQARLQTARERYTADPSDKMRAALRTAVREFGSAHRAAKDYGISVTNAGRAQEQLAQRIERTQTALSRQQRLQANQAKRRELQGEVMGIAATAMTVAAPIKLAIDYESDFADLKKVANFADAEQEKRVQKDIFSVAQRTGINASGMTKIAAAAAESGAVNDAQGNLDATKLKKFLSDAAEMSVAYGISAEEAGERLAIFQSRMELTPERTKAMGDAMNYLASKTNATAAKTSQVVSRIGAVGVTAGLSEKSIVGLAGALVSTSESPEVAGTAMKSFLLALAQGDAMSKTQQTAFASIGIRNVKALAEGMKKGGPEAENVIMTVLEAMRKMPESMQAGIAKDIFGLESFASIAPLVNNPKKLQEAFRLANSKEAVGSQLREFETRSNTTAGAIDRLKASAGILGITLGSVMLPPLAAVANAASTVLSPVTALAERFPAVTSGVMFAALALVTLKVGALAGTYAATVLSDGWTIAKNVLHVFTPATMRANAALLRQRTSSLAAAAGARIMAAGTRTAAAGMWLLNAVMSNNPVGWGVKGVAALIAGMVYLYNTCEPVRTVFDQTFGWIGQKAEWAWNKLRKVGEWLGMVDEAEAGADKQSATTRTASVATVAADPMSPALPPPSMVAPKEWNVDAALSGTVPPTMSSPPVAGNAPAAPGGLTFNLSFPISGVPDGDFGKRVVDALKRRQGDFAALIADIVGEQRRLAYGD